MYVLLSESGATSTRSGGLFTKCMFRVGEGKMFPKTPLARLASVTVCQTPLLL